MLSTATHQNYQSLVFRNMKFDTFGTCRYLFSLEYSFCSFHYFKYSEGITTADPYNELECTEREL